MTRSCTHEGCKTHPVFGNPGSRVAEYCGRHKEARMVDVKSKRCGFDGCTAQPVFGNPGSRVAEYCGRHKEAGMVDVKSKRCGFEGCTVRAWYGTPGIGPERCAEHRLAGMSTRPNARCNVCKEPATRGSADGKPVRCAGHSLPGDLNLVERRCAECGLLWVLDRRGYCEYCQPAVFKRARLAKQRDLTDYLDSRGLPGAQTDRIVDGGECGMERPDRVYLDPEGRFVLILEIDENQHRDRACECEQIDYAAMT